MNDGALALEIDKEKAACEDEDEVHCSNDASDDVIPETNQYLVTSDDNSYK